LKTCQRVDWPRAKNRVAKNGDLQTVAELSGIRFWIFLANARTTDRSLKQYTENSIREDATVMKKSDIKSAQKRAQAWLNEHPWKAEQ
jgi:hypothetical protein